MKTRWYSKSYANADYDAYSLSSIIHDQDEIEFSSESQKWRLEFEIYGQFVPIIIILC